MKSFFRTTVRLTFFYLGLWRLGYRLYNLMKRKPLLLVFTFHRVTESARSQNYYMYYEKGIDREIFEWQLEGIASYFNVIGLDEFTDIVGGRSAPQRHSALITFDDADSEFVVYALPALKRRNFSSVMFAPTDFIDTDKRFWHLRISNIIHQLTPAKWAAVRSRADKLPAAIRQVISREFPESEAQRAALALDLNHRLDKEDIRDVLTIIDSWESIVGENFVLDIKCLSWDQLRALESDSVYIESHSVSHGKLANLEPGEIKRELLCSREKLERELGRKVRAISYPGGSYNEDVLRAAGETGYTLGFTTETGVCPYPLNGKELFRLPRFSLYGDSRPEIHYVLGLLPIKSMLGKKL